MKRKVNLALALVLLCINNIVAGVTMGDESHLLVNEIKASGTCGDNLTWKLTEEYELIIEGTGEIANTPWSDIKGTITKVTFPEGVTGTKSYAFEGCSSLKAVNIPDNSQLISIETAMFKNCNSLSSIDIPASVTSIGYYAFDGCSSLAAITIPENVETIGNYTFRYCGGLTSITIKATTPPTISNYTFEGVDMSIPVYVPMGSVAAYQSAEYWKNFTNIKSLIASGACGDNLTWELFDDGELIIEGTGDMYGFGYEGSPWFEYRELITEVLIPEGVTNVGEGIFWDCTGLTSVTIPEGVMSIDNYAFAGCRNLASIIIPESVENIGVYAFQNCNSLADITIPEGVTSIGNCTFQNCSSLTSITIPKGVTSIKSAAFEGCSGLSTIICKAATPPTVEDYLVFDYVEKYIPVYVPVNSVDVYKSADYWLDFENIQSPIIASGICGDDLTWKLNEAYELTIEGEGDMYDYESDNLPWKDYRGSIKSATVKDGVTSIGRWAFSRCSQLTSISIAESVTRIGADAIRECSILESLVLPEGLTELGTAVFYKCYKLASIIVPDAVKYIGCDAFEECHELTSVTLPEELETIAEWAFKNCWSLSSITIPAGVTEIKTDAFVGCDDLASITCKALTPPTIDASTFAGVDQYIPVYVPESTIASYQSADYWNGFNNIQRIADIASGVCGDDLTWKLTYEGELMVEGTGAMYDYEELSYDYDCDFNYPWWEYRNQIKTVTTGEGVTSIGNTAFRDCTEITAVNLNGGLTHIGEEAFRWCFKLETIDFPESLISIANLAFFDCFGLLSVIIPENVISIGDEAFSYCERLTEIVCKATTPPSIDLYTFSDISWDVSVSVPLASIGAYKSSEYWNEFNNLVGTGLCGDGMVGELLPEGKLTIKGEGAITETPWSGCKEQIKEIVIEEGITGIADGAFAGLDCLNSITSYAVIPPACGTDVLANVKKTTPIYVPVEVLEAYKNAEGWREFVNLTSMNCRILLDEYIEYSQAEQEAFNKITYVRTFNNTHWQALYLPFEIAYEDICEDFDVAYIYDTHQYDTNNDGVKDETEIEIFVMKEGILAANYPYLIRAKSVGEKRIVVSNATLYATEGISIDCSSIFDTYTFTGTYSTMPDELTESGCYTLIDGVWQPVTEETAIGAFRFYLKVDSRYGNASKAQAIRMRIVGDNNDESGETTDVDSLVSKNKTSDIIYDLQGRRVEKVAKGVYIVNGKKVVIK